MHRTEWRGCEPSGAKRAGAVAATPRLAALRGKAAQYLTRASLALVHHRSRQVARPPLLQERAAREGHRQASRRKRALEERPSDTFAREWEGKRCGDGTERRADEVHALACLTQLLLERQLTVVRVIETVGPDREPL